jgi:glutathione S-transferase
MIDNYALSTCSQKVRLALAEKGLAFSEEQVDLPQALPRIRDWYARVCERPSFSAAFYPGSRVNPTSSNN